MARSDKLALGTFIFSYGSHPAGWLHPGSQVDANNSFAHMLNVAKLSEQGRFDFMFLADSPAASVGNPAALKRMPHKMNRFEPLTLLSALAVATDRIGLAATLSTSYYEPYNVARLFGSLDHLSGGRACWNVVTSDHDETGYNYNREGLPPHAERYERAREFLDVCCGLWDGWEKDALLMDREAGVYYDEDLVHTLNHKGKHFQVRGPLNIARSPQGRPVIAQAGGSPAGIELAAQSAEIIFARAAGFDGTKQFYDKVKGRMAAYGRPRDQLKIMPGFTATVGETEAEAQAKVQFLAEKMHPIVGLHLLGEFMEADLTDLALDKPFPLERLPDAPKGSKALFDDVREFVSSNRPVGELIKIYAARVASSGIVGTPTQIADVMEEWFVGEACDGFILQMPALPADLEDFVKLVVPELQRRGLLRRDYEGKTLRDHLGLADPVNRYESLRRA
ncbi:LLM class flavin-dependent oxidoreductase [Acidisoma cellulosilytica]|uniref:LLM class flavin-dependent oxidoreductase n=1 Tax=Acidisoma cellulosilyticum TaxID=2802395 RepID=A0A963YXH3_9PROT|nr:LLM class flavin-dependent oxidoreductase [Acidisoma cellulosilyticum]MCB8878664.1 LLM class flavin-dependent oxidoreductase [Acidisoma cellulosilyticum]